MKLERTKLFFMSLCAILATQIDLNARGGGFGGGFAAGAFTGAALTGMSAAAASRGDRDYYRYRDAQEENYYLRSELEQLKQQNMQMQQQMNELQRSR